MCGFVCVFIHVCMCAVCLYMYMYGVCLYMYVCVWCVFIHVCMCVVCGVCCVFVHVHICVWCVFIHVCMCAVCLYMYMYVYGVCLCMFVLCVLKFSVMKAIALATCFVIAIIVGSDLLHIYCKQVFKKRFSIQGNHMVGWV